MNKPKNTWQKFLSLLETGYSTFMRLVFTAGVITDGVNYFRKGFTYLKKHFKAFKSLRFDILFGPLWNYIDAVGDIIGIFADWGKSKVKATFNFLSAAFLIVSTIAFMSLLGGWSFFAAMVKPLVYAAMDWYKRAKTQTHEGLLNYYCSKVEALNKKIEKDSNNKALNNKRDRFLAKAAILYKDIPIQASQSGSITFNKSQQRFHTLLGSKKLNKINLQVLQDTDLKIPSAEDLLKNQKTKLAEAKHDTREWGLASASMFLFALAPLVPPAAPVMIIAAVVLGSISGLAKIRNFKNAATTLWNYFSGKTGKENTAERNNPTPESVEVT